MCEIVLRRRRWAICRADNAMIEMEREREKGGENTFPQKWKSALKRNHFRRVQDAAPLPLLPLLPERVDLINGSNQRVEEEREQWNYNNRFGNACALRRRETLPTLRRVWRGSAQASMMNLQKR